MRHTSSAVPAVGDLDRPCRARHQRARVAFAVAWVVGTVVACVVPEASNWHRARPLGLQVHAADRSVCVDVGGAAEAAGVVAGPELRLVDGSHLVSRRGRPGLALDSADVVLDGHLRLHLRDGVTETTIWTWDRDRDGEPVAFTIAVDDDAPRSWVRTPPARDAAGAPVLAGLVVAVCVWLHRRRGPSISTTTATTATAATTFDPALHERSVVWPAVVTTLFVPLLAHQLVSGLIGGSARSLYVAVAVVTTGPAHLVLLAFVAGAACHWADGEFDVRPHGWALVLVFAALVPGVLLVVPTVLVLALSAALSLGLRAWARRLAGDQTAGVAADVAGGVGAG